MNKYILYGQVATLITAMAYLPYIFSILKNKTKPDRTTWSILFLIGIITFFTYRGVGADTTLGVAFVNVIGPLIIFLLSLKFGEGWKNKNNFKYLIFSVIAIILWQIYKSPLVGLIFNLMADFMAFVPTIKKSFSRPWTEDLLTWCLFAIGGIINLFAIKEWRFDIFIYPIYILLAEGGVATLLLWSYLKRELPALLQKKGKVL